MKMLNERCEWFDQEQVVCPHIAAMLLDISVETLQAMVEDKIGPMTVSKSGEPERDYGSGFIVFKLWQWAKRAGVGPFIRSPFSRGAWKLSVPRRLMPG